MWRGGLVRAGRGGLLLVLAVALTACPGTDEAGDDGQAPDPDPAPVTDDADEAPPAEAEAEDEPLTAPDPPGEPLATVAGTVLGITGSLPGTLEILDLRRSGDIVTLAFAIALGEGDDVQQGSACPFAAEVDTDVDAPQPRCHSMSGVTLVDPVNGNRHLVLREPDGACVCTSNIPNFLKGGERYSFSASFAAPPSDVRAMSVSVPQFAGVEDVPISGG